MNYTTQDVSRLSHDFSDPRAQLWLREPRTGNQLCFTFCVAGVLIGVVLYLGTFVSSGDVDGDRFWIRGALGHLDLEVEFDVVMLNF